MHVIYLALFVEKVMGIESWPLEPEKDEECELLLSSNKEPSKDAHENNGAQETYGQDDLFSEMFSIEALMNAFTAPLDCSEDDSDSREQSSTEMLLEESAFHTPVSQTVNILPLAQAAGANDPVSSNRYTCQICGRRYKYPSGLCRHITLEHGDLKDLLRRFGCNICGKSYTYECTLEDHKKNKHSGITNTSLTKNTCEICDRRYSFSNGLVRHNKTKHADAEQTDVSTDMAGDARRRRSPCT